MLKNKKLMAFNDDELVFAIKDALKKKNICDGNFIAVVADLAQGYNFVLQDPKKSILRALCSDSEVQTLVEKKGKVRDLDSEVKQILYRLKNTKALDEGLVFDVLKQLLKGAGCKMPSDNIVAANNLSQTASSGGKSATKNNSQISSPSVQTSTKSNPQATINQPQSAQVQQNPTAVPNKRSWTFSRGEHKCSRKTLGSILLNGLKKMKSGLKDDVRWLKEYYVVLAMIYFYVCSALFVVSLIAIIIGWIDGWGHAPVWTWLFWESIVIGVLCVSIAINDD